MASFQSVTLTIAVAAFVFSGCGRFLVERPKTGGLTEKNLPSAQVAGQPTDQIRSGAQAVHADSQETQANSRKFPTGSGGEFESAEPQESLSTQEVPDDDRHTTVGQVIQVTSERLTPATLSPGTHRVRADHSSRNPPSANHLEQIDRKLSQLMLSVTSLEQIVAQKRALQTENSVSTQLEIIDTRLELLQAQLEEMGELSRSNAKDRQQADDGRLQDISAFNKTSQTSRVQANSGLRTVHDLLEATPWPDQDQQFAPLGRTVAEQQVERGKRPVNPSGNVEAIPEIRGGSHSHRSILDRDANQMIQF